MVKWIKKIEILEKLKEIKDPRMDRKKRYFLINIMVITISAVICGADNWNEIELYGKAKEELYKKFLELPNGIPFQRQFGLLK